MRAINFEFNKDRSTGPSTPTLDEVASAMLRQPQLSKQSGGYTDSVGAPAYNQKLSPRRADAVPVDF